MRFVALFLTTTL